MPKIKYGLLFINFFLIFFFFSSCITENQPVVYPIEKTAIEDSVMVVSPHPLASEIGAQILAQGGNAIDAAVAVQFAIAVVYPRAGNIGGGGFMVIRMQDGEYASLDYREKAPAAAHKDMYLDEKGDVIKGLSSAGHLAVGVPGTVAGLFEAHRKYGAIKDIKDLISPAIALAANGYHISETEANRLQKFQSAFAEFNERPNVFMKPDWKPGDLLVQKDLAQTLQLIADQGTKGFYEGTTADKIVAEMERGKGLITLEDLKSYQAAWRTPIVDTYKNYRIISMPPPSSGGIALAQLLKMTEPYNLSQYGFHSTKAIHVLVEAMRRVYADRASYLGDTDFYPVPIDSLLDDEYILSRMESFSWDTASLSTSILAGDFNLQKESFETTHTSVVDQYGNAVSVTTTLNFNFGSKVLVQDAGFFLNNEMDDFSAKPGVPNEFGLIGAAANSIQPGKRMLSSMTPSILEKDDQLFMVLGAPGGSTIITSVFQVILNVTEYGKDIHEAVSLPRFHHQWLPNAIIHEKGAIDSLTLQELSEMGHVFREVASIAVVKAILVNPDGTLQGAGDFRNPDDDVEGF